MQARISAHPQLKACKGPPSSTAQSFSLDTQENMNAFVVIQTCPLFCLSYTVRFPFHACGYRTLSLPINLFAVFELSPVNVQKEVYSVEDLEKGPLHWRKGMGEGGVLPLSLPC